MIDISINKQMMLYKEDNKKRTLGTNFQGELKNPFDVRNKHIRIKGPTPNTKRTIFAVLGVVFFSSFASVILEVDFFLIFFLGISKIDVEAILTIIKQD